MNLRRLTHEDRELIWRQLKRYPRMKLVEESNFAIGCHYSIPLAWAPVAISWGLLIYVVADDRPDRTTLWLFVSPQDGRELGQAIRTVLLCEGAAGADEDEED